MERPYIDREAFLTPLPEGDGGLFLRYDAVYDQIREARRFDDERLSQGVWKIDPKKAQWPRVEVLCVDILTQRSKDLQVLGWLIESWIALDGLSGASRGFDLLESFCQIFLDIMHPLVQDDEGEYRERILEWMNQAFTDQILSIPLTSASPTIALAALTLGDWIEAVELEKIIKRSGQSPKSSYESWESKGKITLPRFRKGLAHTPFEHLEMLYGEAEQALSYLDRFRDHLEKKWSRTTPTLGQVRHNIEEILRLLKVSLEQKAPITTSISPGEVSTIRPEDLFIEEPSPSVLEPRAEPITQRSDIYRSFRENLGVLKKIDPNSPVGPLIELALSFENKSLLHILKDLQEGKSEAHTLLRLLIPR